MHIGGCLGPLGVFAALTDAWTARIVKDPGTTRHLLMLFRLFRKQPDPRPRFEQDAAVAEALRRRVNSIEFQPSKGFLKDQRQPKR
ncbi:MAG: hypothetical protein ACREUC_13330, partial [Steroidobacteraceae bacterium]